MKTKIVLLLLLTVFASESFGIGFPHGLAKKKKAEQIENSKKDSKFEKKVILIGNTISYILVKLGNITK